MNMAKQFTAEFGAWNSMRTRCLNPKNAAFKNYGGRGIFVCPEWAHFANFLKDMGPRPAGHSLDRIDNNGNYTPSNCRWATREQQNSNRRTALLVNFGGQLMPLAEAHRASSSPATYSTVWSRLHKGWDLETALCTPQLFGRELRRRQSSGGFKGNAIRYGRSYGEEA